MDLTTVQNILFPNGITVQLLIVLGMKNAGSNIMDVLSTVKRSFLFIKNEIIAHCRNPGRSVSTMTSGWGTVVRISVRADSLRTASEGTQPPVQWYLMPLSRRQNLHVGKRVRMYGVITPLSRKFHNVAGLLN
jgi:hypothetical protein